MFKIHAYGLIPIASFSSKQLEHNSLPVGVSSIKRNENAIPSQWWEESMAK
jgi:hypothetical protein